MFRLYLFCLKTMNTLIILESFDCDTQAMYDVPYSHLQKMTHIETREEYHSFIVDYFCYCLDLHRTFSMIKCFTMLIHLTASRYVGSLVNSDIILITSLTLVHM
jgi:hypothetical protein